ncbi:DNA topoisomerase III [Mucilaginibacter myungsuensis]|uniref:DNA topoisomerase n=1 Tax=Mucilaginibacter myungsuensis TaxID=649104 RepID=A0A929KXF3_9SPHI|nr:DNA topoisomerase III [Mucilaginibacter myungsuensis]MBE9660420.1 DNA topoisomerase III [Mucilaginibacter myungsuensis]MDN3600462.1 DNA topoisomerase III [Mucilaginibacter myungsuensis]
MKVIIAEKPSVGREIARVFGANTKREGYLEGKGYTFTWAFGHLLQLASPQEYGYYGWSVQHLPMLPAKFKLSVRRQNGKEDAGAKKQLEVIRKLFDEATEIIVATDAGREGELIFRYIYYYLKCKKPFRRLWISSQTDEAIKEGFRNLKPGTDYDTLFNSAHCRSQSDWLVGMNATQALSLASGNKGVLSLGRVQTPTLAMICARFLENRDFKPETYFQVAIFPDKDRQTFKAISTKNYKTREEAQAILDAVTATGNIANLESKPRKEPPPLLHDLSSLQQEGNKKKGFTADQTLSLLQNLYEGKLVTYPRTGSRYIGDDVFAQVPDLIAKLGEHPDFGKHAVALNGAKLSKRSVNAKKVTDHHAILTTGEKPWQLTPDQQVIYDLVAGRMLEAFNGDCLKEITKITVVSGNPFVASGTVIRTAGWRAVFNDADDEKKDEENASLPKVIQGEDLPIADKSILEKQTKPKPLYNEATLLKALETAGKEIEDEELREAMKAGGLGTPATRAAIIETLLIRKYIGREKKNLVPTPTGLAVYDVVKHQLIAQAELTGSWEKRLEEIRGGASVSQFQDEIKAYTREITGELLRSGKGVVLPTATQK